MNKGNPHSQRKVEMMARGFHILLLFLFCATAFGQQKEEKKIGDYLEFNGYLKHMNIGSWQEEDIGNIITQNFFHNRLNFKAYPSSSITIALEGRTRLFYGEQVKMNPQFGQQIESQYPQRFDVQALLVDEPGMVLHSKLDRAYVDFSKGKFEITAGRQRINWGMNLIWNPNDLFNVFSFVDFDYQERPGSDALKVKYYPKMMNSLEVAVRPGKNEDDWIGAIKYGFNKKGYDFQILGGNYYQDYALGLGWAGNIKNAGFKGEATYFHPRDKWQDTSGVTSAAITLDYVFPNSLYLAGSFLWNSEGFTDNPVQPMNLFTARLSPKSLMPTEFSLMAQLSGNISPILNGSISPIWAPGSNALFIMPSLTYSIKENWDISLYGQTFFIETTEEFVNLGNGAFLRLQWSF